MLTVEKWQVFEFQVTTDKVFYDNPYYDVDITAIFTGPNRETIMRPAFWIGKNSWGIRFAPISVGEWTYSLSCSDMNNTAFNNIRGAFTCTEYTGDMEIYKKGFIKTIKGKHFLYYNDGTPFFWLGDTHWNLFCLERLNESNKEGFDSQFRGMVDKRVKQKFTVYQTNLLGDIDLTDDGSGFFIAGSDYSEINLDFFANDVDPKAAYLAEKGLVNAMGFMWQDKINILKEKVLRFAYYIVARYGAYPVIWTLGGEVPGYDGKKENVAAWGNVGLSIQQWDGYHHLITNHNSNNRPLATHYIDESWHSFSMGQLGHGDNDMNVQYYRDFFSEYPEVPYVESEAMYTGLQTLEYNGRRIIDAQMTLNAACRAIQSGCCGYGLGVQGVWNAAWSSKGLSFDRYIFWGMQDWKTGIDLPIGDYMTNLRNFYEKLPWIELEPKKNIITTAYTFNTATYTAISNAFMATATALTDLSLIVIYIADNVPPWIGYLLIGLAPSDSYSIQKYSLIDDKYIDLEPITISNDGTAELPAVVEAANSQGWLVVLKKVF